MSILETLNLTEEQKKQLIKEILTSYSNAPILKKEFKTPHTNTIKKEELNEFLSDWNSNSKCVADA